MSFSRSEFSTLTELPREASCFEVSNYVGPRLPALRISRLYIYAKAEARMIVKAIDGFCYNTDMQGYGGRE